jgi:hypothetical protein
VADRAGHPFDLSRLAVSMVVSFMGGDRPLAKQILCLISKTKFTNRAQK